MTNLAGRRFAFLPKARPGSPGAADKYLSISLAAVVQHLQVLQDSGLVRTEKAGRVRTCHIEPAALAAAEQWIRDRRSIWERRFDRLGDLLAEPDGK